MVICVYSKAISKLGPSLDSCLQPEKTQSSSKNNCLVKGNFVAFKLHVSLVAFYTCRLWIEALMCSLWRAFQMAHTWKTWSPAGGINWRWLDPEGADLISGLIYQKACRGFGYLVVGPCWRVGSPGVWLEGSILYIPSVIIASWIPGGEQLCSIMPLDSVRHTVARPSNHGLKWMPHTEWALVCIPNGISVARFMSDLGKEAKNTPNGYPKRSKTWPRPLA